MHTSSALNASAPFLSPCSSKPFDANSIDAVSLIAFIFTFSLDVQSVCADVENKKIVAQIFPKVALKVAAEVFTLK